MAPQGVGAALAMPFAGKLTDRIGGGRVALAGMIVVTVSTIPFATSGRPPRRVPRADARPPRHRDRLRDDAGDGGRVRDAHAARRAARDKRAERAARVGGSVGTALLAVVLQRQIVTRSARAGAGSGAGGGVLQRVPEDVRQKIAEPVATAFGNTFWWAVGMSAVAIIPTAILARSQRRERRAQVLAEAQSPVA